MNTAISLLETRRVEQELSGKRSLLGNEHMPISTRVLDGLVEADVLPPERRPGAEFLSWSAVHGLAMLLIDGPLRGLEGAQTKTSGTACWTWSSGVCSRPERPAEDRLTARQTGPLLPAPTTEGSAASTR